jgi:enamine deaminase RidA (YjgF/YER057c/UK114 family)
VCIHAGERFELVSVCVPQVAVADGPGVEQAAVQGYREIGLHLEKSPGWHPVRIWNFVPRIIDPADGGMDRYMRFNAGRHRVFTEWFGGAGNFDRMLPTASAVGHGGDDLVVHALTCREAGTAIDNPRQLAPYHYSKRFGPLPPCFARAMRVTGSDNHKLLLVGGTASVRGEESVHVGNLEAQLGETFENLKALVRNAFGPSTAADPLRHYRNLRVYHVSSPFLPTIQSAVAAQFPSLIQAEWIEVDLCRGDLLVEIEGLASEIR